MSASDWEVHHFKGIPDPERDSLYLLHLEETGVLAEVERIWDAIEAGEDMGPSLTWEEVRERLDHLINEKEAT